MTLRKGMCIPILKRPLPCGAFDFGEAGGLVPLY